jgi:hypothetical protein
LAQLNPTFVENTKQLDFEAVSRASMYSTLGFDKSFGNRSLETLNLVLSLTLKLGKEGERVSTLVNLNKLWCGESLHISIVIS